MVLELILTSMSGSLLWALNYANWSFRKGYTNIEIILIDTWKIPQGLIYPAKSLVEHLEIPARHIPWHDDPYHEHILFGGLDPIAIVGSVCLETVTGEEISTLLPGFDKLEAKERLLQSLKQFQARWQFSGIFGSTLQDVNITDSDIWAASVTAHKFVKEPDLALRTLVTVMFLSFQKRHWNKEVWKRIQSVFQGSLPSS